MKSGWNRKGARLAAMVLLLCLSAGAAMGDNMTIMLPDGAHYLTLPEGMTYQDPALDETDLAGIYLMPPDLEMLIFAYSDPGYTLDQMAEALVNAGREAQLRNVNGTEFLVYQDTDESDGAPCIGYSYFYGNRLVEINFFYATQNAMDWTQGIMESFQ